MITDCIYVNVANDPSETASPAPAQYLAAWAESHSAPIALLSRDQRVLWANDRAKAIFAEGDPFLLKDGVFVAADKSQAGLLQTFFDGLTEASDSRVCKGVNGLPMIVRAHVVHVADGSSAIAMSLLSTETAERYVWTDFGDAFKLTRSEVEVAKRILDGGSADDVAEQLGVSVETVRTHIRSLYGKLSINSRERLFALISPYRIG